VSSKNRSKQVGGAYRGYDRRMSARACRALRAVALVVLGAACLVPAAHAGRVTVVVVPSIDPVEANQDGAIGLLVPGAGSTVTRDGALSSLVRGKVVSSLLGGKAAGKPLIRLSGQAEVGAITIYVTLPPPGRSHNTRRYPIAIVGGGYRGLLVSQSTRIPGLVSIADVAPTAVDLARGDTPVIRWREPETAATGILADLDGRLRDAHDTRTAATIILVASTLVLAGLALLLRSPFLARAGLLAIPAALTISLALSATGVSRPTPTTAVLAVATVAAALVLAVRRSWLLPVLVALLVAELVVLAVWPDVNALSVIGPHPDGGGRYFGITNEVETLLLAPILAAASIVSQAALVPVAALSLALVGWSRAGADGGGIIVVLVALGSLWLLRERIRLTPGRVAIAVVGVVAVSLAVIGLDALTGGSSHVTHAVGGGPGSLFGDLGHRLRISWHGVTATIQSAFAAGATLCALVGVGLRRLRVAIVDALLVSLLVSLLVNDTPTDVLAYGALVAAALRVWATVDARARVRSGEAVYLRASPEPPWR
jgi:hypothetical protein